MRKLGNTNPVWFEAQEPSDCDVVPEQVNAGKPPRDICANVSVYKGIFKYLHSSSISRNIM